MMIIIMLMMVMNKSSVVLEKKTIFLIFIFFWLVKLKSFDRLIGVRLTKSNRKSKKIKTATKTTPTCIGCRNWFRIFFFLLLLLISSFEFEIGWLVVNLFKSRYNLMMMIMMINNNKIKLLTSLTITPKLTIWLNNNENDDNVNLNGQRAWWLFKLKKNQITQWKNPIWINDFHIKEKKFLIKQSLYQNWFEWTNERTKKTKSTIIIVERVCIMMVMANPHYQQNKTKKKFQTKWIASDYRVQFIQFILFHLVGGSGKRTNERTKKKRTNEFLSSTKKEKNEKKTTKDYYQSRLFFVVVAGTIIIIIIIVIIIITITIIIIINDFDSDEEKKKKEERVSGFCFEHFLFQKNEQL